MPHGTKSDASSGRFLRIVGGAPLTGTATVSGSKNAALPMMAAAILADGPITLNRVPRLTDVDTMARLLRRLGVEVDRRGERLVLESREAAPKRAPLGLVRQMRASFCVLGPLLARRGRAVVPLPGGCRIGDRPVDLHLRGMAALGATIELRRGSIIAQADELHGAEIDLAGPAGPTVTGTANVLSAAVLARGTTVIHHAAREPEIVDLGRLLVAMGARIEGLGSATIRVDGVSRLAGATHTIIPDRIEAATLLMAAAVTGGHLTLTRAEPSHLTAVLELLEAAGCRIETADDRIDLVGPRRLRAVDLAAEPFPGAPTDVQAPWTALMALAEGESSIRDRVFPARFEHLAELRRMGARVEWDGQRARVSGVEGLDGAAVSTSDLRSGAALLLAGLAARGETMLSGLDHLDRGYERLDLKLRRLGATIYRNRIGKRVVTF